ncbi:MAG: hypothetical protein Q8L27_04220, partial [archaeon]|nr:hypothetical protein [archaeon]
KLNYFNFIKENIFNKFLKSAAIKNDDDFQIILEMLEAGEKGTVIGFEDWFHNKCKIREITEQDPETGELKFKEKIVKKWNDVRSSLVNLEDFYPGNINVRPGKIQDMDDCFLRTIMAKDEFDAEFGKYTDADKVETITSLVNTSTPFWKQSNDVTDEYVEVLRYFNQRTDEYIIIANGIWINPVGKSTVSPLPWNHKKLPFWASVFEPLDANCFYGRSFIDKLISICDGQDALFDRILDQMTLAISKPIVTDGSATSLVKGFLQPQNVITVDWTNGRPNFETVPIQDPSSVGLSLYQLMNQKSETASISSEVIGGSAMRRKTAEEVATQREAANQLVSLFLKFMEFGSRDKFRLRFANQLQFYSMPIHDEDTGERFKSIVLKNEELSNGKRGTIEISIVLQPSQERVEQTNKYLNKNNEIIEISPSFIRNYEYDIEVIAQSSIKMTEAQRQILELNYQKVMFELYPDMFNKEAGFEELNLKFGKDSSKMKIQKSEEQPVIEGEGMGGTLEEIMGAQRQEQPQLKQTPQAIESINNNISE